jgi:hypothetical protein
MWGLHVTVQHLAHMHMQGLRLIVRRSIGKGVFQVYGMPCFFFELLGQLLILLFFRRPH